MTRGTQPAGRQKSWLAGMLVILAVAALARGAAQYAKPVPDVILALALGLAIRNILLGTFVKRNPLAGAVLRSVVYSQLKLDDAIAFTIKFVLRAAIILLGSGLSLAMVLSTGAHTLALVVACVIIAMSLGLAMSRAFRLRGVVGTLIGAGTAICGATAILTVAPLARAKDEEVAYALTTIFTFNILALVLYPWLGHLMHLSAASFGSWAGTAVNDTSIVVATGYVFSDAAGAVATIVKLTRTVLLVPLAVVIGVMYGALPGTAPRQATVWARAKSSFPWFVIGFVAMAAVNSFGLLPATLIHGLTAAAGFLIVMVLAAVGLNVNVNEVKKMGARPLLVGFVLASFMAACSLMLVRALRIV